MAVGYGNLSGYVQQLINGNYPDIGQIHYVVDPDFRTAAQGWSRPDRTGPLDLWAARAEAAGSQYVYYGSGTGSPIAAFASDRDAIQAAIDAAIDFRGDTIFFTPGSYSIATTAIDLDVANLRFLGPPVRNPRRSAVTITDAIGDNPLGADNLEIAFLRMVPLTATNFWEGENGTDNVYIHDCMYDAQGVAADTATEFVNAAATCSDWEIENVYHIVDALQGDCYTLATATRWRWYNCEFHTEVASYATVMTFATNSVGNVVDLCRFTADADGTFTNIFTGAANENQQLFVSRCYVSGTALATASDIETGFGTATDIELAENYQTGDATGEGGVVIALA